MTLLPLLKVAPRAPRKRPSGFRARAAAAHLTGRTPSTCPGCGGDIGITHAYCEWCD